MNEHYETVDEDKILNREKPHRVVLVGSRGMKNGNMASDKENKWRKIDERVPNAPKGVGNAEE